MKDKTKTKYSSKINPTFRYSHTTSSNSSETSELDYNFYCYSQGFKNREKGYWRGVLRGKNVDYDLRNNKEWNRRIELEDDEFDKTYYSSKKSDLQFRGSDRFSKEYITLINDSEIGWDTSLFKKFQKYQQLNGIRKNMNREWLLSNGIKRGSGTEIRSQTYKQFETSEHIKSQKYVTYSDKNKEWGDNKNIKEERKYSYGFGSGGSKNYDFTEKKTTQKKCYISQMSESKKAMNSTTNIKDQGSYGEKYCNKNIEINFTGKPGLNYSKNNLETDFNYGKYKKQQHLEKNKSFNFKKYDNLDISKPVQIQGNKVKKVSKEKSYEHNMFKSPSPLGKTGKQCSPGGYNSYSNLGYTSPVNKKIQKIERKEIKYGQNIERKQSYDGKGKPLNYLEKINNIDKNKLSIDKSKKYGITTGDGRFDRSMDKIKRTSSYDSKEKIKKKQKKITETNIRKELKPVFSQDRQTSKYGQYTPGKSPYDKTKTQKSPKQTICEQKKIYQKQIQKSTYVKSQYDTPNSGMQPRGKSPKGFGQSPSKTKGQTPTAYNSLSYKGSKNKDSPQKTIYDKSSYQKVTQQTTSQTRRCEYDSSSEYNKTNSKEKSKATKYNKNKSPKSSIEITSKTTQSTYDKNKSTKSPKQYSQVQIKTVQSIYDKNKQIQSQQSNSIYDKDKNKQAYSPSKQNLQIQSKFTQSIYEKNKKSISPSKQSLQIQSIYEKTKKTQSPQKQIQSIYEKTKKTQSPQKPAQKVYDKNKLTQSLKIQSTYDKTKKTQSPQKQVQSAYDKYNLTQSLKIQTTYDKSKTSQSPKQAYTTQSKTTHLTYDKTKSSQSPNKVQTQTKTNKITYDSINQTLSPKSKFKAMYDINKPSSSPKQKTTTQSQLKIKQTTYQKSKASSSPSQSIETQSKTVQSIYEKSKQSILPKQKTQTQVITMKSTYPSQSQKQTIQSISRTTQSIYDKSKPSQSLNQTIQSQSRTNQTTYDKSKQTQTPKKSIESQTSTIQSQYEKNKKQLKYGQTRTKSQYDITKFKNYFNKAVEPGDKKRNKDKPYSKRFDFDSSDIVLKHYKKKGSSYDKKKSRIKGELLIHENLLERPENLVRLEVSVEEKRSDSEKIRTPEGRKHETILFNARKKRKQSYDSQGKPLTNTRRLNDSQESIKEKSEERRLSNYIRIESSVENTHREEKHIREPGERRHEVLISNPKKKRKSYDKNGKPLTNTMRLNDSQETPKKPYEGQRLSNYTRIESSVEKKKKEKRPSREPGARKNEVLKSGKKETKKKYDSKGKPITNVERVNVSIENNKEYVEKVDYNEESYKDRLNLFKKSPISKIDITNKYIQRGSQPDSKKTPFGSYIQSLKEKDKNKKFGIYQKTQILSQQKSFVQQMDKKPGMDSQQKINLSIDKNKYSYDIYPSSRKTDKNQQIFTKIKTKIKTANQFQYTKNNEKDNKQKSKPSLDGTQKPKAYGSGITPDYKKYVKASKIKEQKSINKDIKTGSTYFTQSQKDLNKTIESSSLYSSNQKSYIKDYGTDSLKDSRQKLPSNNIGSNPFGTGPYKISINTTKKYVKSDIMNKSFDSPKTKDRNYVSNYDKYKTSATDKNKYLQTQTSQQYKQPQKIKPFAQSSNLIDSKELTQYYYPNKDSKQKYSSPDKKTSSIPKAPKTDMIKKTDSVYKGLQTQTQTQIQTNQKDNLTQYSKIQQSQKFIDKSKVGFTPMTKQKTCSYFKTEYTSGQKGLKPSDSKIIFTKYQQKKSPEGKDINKTYLFSSERKDYDYQTETNISSIYQPKNGKKEKYTIQKISKGSANTFGYKPACSSINKKLPDKKGLASETSYGYKSNLNNSLKQTNSFFGTYQNISDKNNKTISKGYDKYNKDGLYTKKESYKVSTTSDKGKNIESSSKSFKKDKDKTSSYFDQSKTKKTGSELYKNKNSSNLDEGMGGGRRNKSNENISFGPSGYGYGDDYGMAYFKLKFLTTKEVCEKFWKSIDDGELPISMFDPNRKSGSKFIK